MYKNIALRHEILDTNADLAAMLQGAETAMMTSVSSSMMTSVSASMMTSVSASMMTSVSSASMTSVSQDARTPSDLCAKLSGLQTCLMTSVSDI